MHELASRRVVPTSDDVSSTTRAVDGSTRGRWGSIRGVTYTHTSTTVTTATEIEVVLPNGDLYMGTFSESLPYGNGKYLWSDGCMYEGEWKNGKARGRGKFSWPSGATYEGEFNDGRMEGKGTFIGAYGDTYRGTWVRDRKHGFGEKLYTNGDIYTGLWKWNAQDGEGRYLWSNGNEYVGEWKNGVMCGKGMLIWANGKRYEGDWLDGVPKGSGVFTWPDGVEFGAKSGAHHKTRRSAVGNKNDDLKLNLPSICTWESDGDVTCDVVSNNKDDKLMLPEKKDHVVGQLRKSHRLYEGTEVKKCGQVASRGHKSYELMLNFQLGIRYSTEKHAAMTRELRQSDFDPKEKFWTRFPPEGSKSTPSHQLPDFKWKDYCPMVFKHLRELFRVDPAEYMLAICGSDALRELSSPGKSGSLFYLTQDERFIIKTLRKSEVKVLLRMLPNYYEHISQCKNTLVTNFFGVHCVKPIGGQKTRFTVMGNVFYSGYGIHKRFDLKGSSYGRVTHKPDEETDETTTFKDLDLDFVFHLQRSWFDELIRLIDRDCQFLEAENIMDYSLLIGVHFCNKNALTVDDYSGEKNAQDYKFSSTTDMNLQRKLQLGLGRNLPGKAIRVSRMGCDQITGSRDIKSTSTPNNGETCNVILYLGIIDILQDYDITKKLEHAYKSIQFDPASISAVDPKLYSKRFRDFIHKIFLEDDR